MRAAFFSAFASARKRRNQRRGCCKHAHAHTHGFTISSIDNTSTTCPHHHHIIVIMSHILISRKARENIVGHATKSRGCGRRRNDDTARGASQQHQAQWHGALHFSQTRLFTKATSTALISTTTTQCLYQSFALLKSIPSRGWNLLCTLLLPFYVQLDDFCC